jgi:hypothetical protein
MMMSRIRSYWLRLREPAGKRKATVFLLCFVSSAVFWLLLQLSRENEAVFSRPFVFYDIPENMLLAGQSDSVLHYSLQTTGARLFASLFSSRDTLYIPLSALARTERDGRPFFFLSGNQAAARVSASLGPGKTVHQISPDTVYVEMVAGGRKLVPVMPVTEITYERRFGPYGSVRVDPDSVWLSGPLGMLDSIHVIETEVVRLHQLQHTTQAEALLRKPMDLPVVRLSPPSVSLTIPVEEFTEARMEVPLGIHCPDSLDGYSGENLRLFPSRVTVTVLVALRDYPALHPGLFSARVLCPTGEATGPRLDVFLEQFPEFVQLEAVRPRQVDYLILK